MNLLVHHGALGDWVLAWPILRTLATQDGVLAVATGGKARLVAEEVAGVRPADADGAWSALFSPGEDPAIAPTVREALAEARRVVSFVSTGHDDWARHARRLAPRSEFCFVTPRPGDDWPGHVTDWHAHQLAQQNWTLATLTIAQRQNPDGPVVVHPGSGGRKKCWPIERFEGLIDALTRRGLAVRVVLGEVELERWPAEVRSRWHRTYDVRTPDVLTDLHTLLRDARLFIGNDSGPTHLAAQMGLRTLALFGPTPPARWSPRGPAVRVLAPPTPSPMQWLSVDTVSQAAMT